MQPGFESFVQSYCLSKVNLEIAKRLLDWEFNSLNPTEEESIYLDWIELTCINRCYADKPSDLAIMEIITNAMPTELLSQLN